MKSIGKVFLNAIQIIFTVLLSFVTWLSLRTQQANEFFESAYASITLSAVILLCSCIILMFSILLFWKYRNHDKRKLHSVDRKSYDALVTKAQKIAYGSNPGKPISYNFLSVKDQNKIKRNGDASVSQIYKIEVLSESLSFFVHRIDADAYSSPVDTLENLGFEVSVDLEGTSAVMVPLRDDPLQKEIACYFLPRLKKGQVVEVSMSYTWAGFFNAFFINNRVDFTWYYDAPNPKKACDLLIEIELDVPKNSLVVEENHEPVLRADAEPSPISVGRKTKITFQKQKASVKDAKYRLSFTRTK